MYEQTFKYLDDIETDRQAVSKSWSLEQIEGELKKIEQEIAVMLGEVAR